MYIIKKLITPFILPPGLFVLAFLSFENAKKVRRICKRFGFQHPILVTSDYHLKRALWSFRKAGLNCVPFANGLASRKGRSYSWEHYLPGSFKKVSQYLHEYIGLLYYRMVY